jgi:hypothetical protein
VAALILAGCGGDQKPAAVGTDPLTEFRAAAVKTMSTSFHVTLSAPRLEASGDVDPIGQALALDIAAQQDDGSAVRQKVRVVGSDAYLTLGDIHVRDIDPTKYIQLVAPSPAFTSASMVHFADPFDPAGLKGLAFAFSGVRRTAGGSFAGTLDLSKALPGVSRGLLPAEPEQLRGAGGAIKGIPFEAAVNGYLTSMTVRIPAYGSAPAYTSRSTFTSFDEHVKVERPQAAEITEVTEELRQILD